MAARLGYARGMERKFGNAPSAAEIEAIARASLERLPEPFAAHLRDVVLTVEELADDDTLGTMGIDDPFDLTGLYHGLPVGQKSVDLSGTLPDRIFLYRRAISTNGRPRGRRSSTSSTTFWCTRSAIISALATRTCTGSRMKREAAPRRGSGAGAGRPTAVRGPRPPPRCRRRAARHRS
jgi:predicted Zn-dependent protease with MMP-like domain